MGLLIFSGFVIAVAAWHFFLDRGDFHTHEVVASAQCFLQNEQIFSSCLLANTSLFLFVFPSMCCPVCLLWTKDVMPPA